MRENTISGFRHLYNQLTREQQIEFLDKVWAGKASTMYQKMRSPMTLYADELINVLAFLGGYLKKELDYTDLTCVVEMKAEITK